MSSCRTFDTVARANKDNQIDSGFQAMQSSGQKSQKFVVGFAQSDNGALIARVEYVCAIVQSVAAIGLNRFRS